LIETKGSGNRGCGPSGGPEEVYRWVGETRKGLADYCASLPPEAYAAQRQDFGWGSIRNVHVHIADCYRFWLAETARGLKTERFEAADCPDAASVARLFEKVDELVAQFCATFAGDALGRTVNLKVRWQDSPFVVTPLWLLTHTFTHEFHHKGQIVALGRILGYPPPETDLASSGAAPATSGRGALRPSRPARRR